MATPFAIKLIDEEDLFSGSQDSPLLGAWNVAAGDVPFRRHEWLATWWKHYRQQPSRKGQSLFVLAITAPDNQICGIVPWILNQDSVKGRVLSFLGSGEVCSDYQTPLVAEIQDSTISQSSCENTRRDMIETLADYLLDVNDKGNADWDLVHLQGVDTDDAAAQYLIDAMRNRGAHIQATESHNCWRIDLPSDWESYLAMLSKSHRKQIRRLKKKHLDSGQFELQTLGSPGEFASYWDDFVTLHRRRRVTLGQAGCFASESFAEFLRDASEQMMHAGILRLHRLMHEGKAVAAEYHLESGGCVYAYQSGIDPDFTDCEPGRLITIGLLTRAIEKQFTGYDFLRGDEPYKAHFRAVPNPAIDLRIVAPRPMARLRYSACQAGSGARQIVKQGLVKLGLRQPVAPSKQKPE